MKINVLASTKVGYNMSKEEAIDFSGKSAGICYLPDSLETLFSESDEKTKKRADGTLKSGHHSVFGHVTYNLSLEGIPKILAMILNNEKVYNTSEKSARYTKMDPSEKEGKLYEKWISIFQEVIKEKHPEIDEKKNKKLAMENARYLISVFTPATIMEYTVSFGQLNYIAHWFENFIKSAEDTAFNLKLKKVFAEFNEQIKDLIVPELNSDVKGRTISLFANRIRQEEFGENYCVNYTGTFAELAQAQRHRTLSYEIFVPKEDHEYFVPPIIKGTLLEKQWLDDITSLDDEFPQGLMLSINERGTVENFVMKCQERLCGAAQLEIALQTKEILDMYMEKTKDSKPEIYNYLLPYSKGARCTFPGFKCTLPCMWGAKKGINRDI